MQKNAAPYALAGSGISAESNSAIANSPAAPKGTRNSLTLVSPLVIFLNSHFKAHSSPPAFTFAASASSTCSNALLRGERMCFAST